MWKSCAIVKEVDVNEVNVPNSKEKKLCFFFLHAN